MLLVVLNYSEMTADKNLFQILTMMLELHDNIYINNNYNIIAEDKINFGNIMNEVHNILLEQMRPTETENILLLFLNRLRDPTACSLLISGSPPQNSGYIINKLCPS